MMAGEPLNTYPIKSSLCLLLNLIFPFLFFQAGAVTHVELGEAEPPASALAGLVVRAFGETQNN